MTPPTVLYILGAPGVGKTALARAILGWAFGAPRPDMRTVMGLVDGAKWTISGGICAAGHYTGKPFDGADTVGYTQAITTLGYWVRYLLPTMSVTILDGDRFSTGPSLEFIQHPRPDLPPLRIMGVHLVASPETLAARREMREGVTAKVQNANWVKGRVTKAANFARRINAVQLNADVSVTTLHAQVNSLLFSPSSREQLEKQEVSRA